MEPLTKFIPDSVVCHLLNKDHYSTDIPSPTTFGNSLETVWREYNTLALVDLPQPAMEEKFITEKASQLQYYVTPPKLLYTQLSPIKVYRAIPQFTAHL